MAIHAESKIQLNTIPVNTSLLGGHFLYKSSESQTGLTKPSANVIQYAGTPSDPARWGYNTNIGANGIKLRHNETTLSEWNINGLTFYTPGTNNPSLELISGINTALNIYNPTNNTKTLGLDTSGLNFYGTSTSTPDVTLNADGLTLINGSIRGGIVGQDEFLYLSPQVFADEYEEYVLSEDTEVDETKVYYIRSGEEGAYIYTEVSEPTGNPQENEYYEIVHAPGTIPIDNYVKDNWRQIIGRKFAVDTDGNLYANGLYANNAELKQANVEGNITATSLMIGSGNTAYDGEAAINITGYTIEIIEDPTDIHVVEANTTYLYPVMYHNGIQVDNSELTLTDYIWYKDDITPGEHGDSVKGGIIASYGHRYKVTYDFADGEVGGGIPVRSVTVDPSKYITQISDTGITIHPEAWENNQSSSINLTASGLDILDRYGNSIAQYGSTARIGLENSSRFLINSTSLQAYDSSNNKYFEVSSSGLSWGSNIAATTADLANKASLSDVADAAKTATNYISTITGGGISVHDENDDDNYAKINADGLEVYRDATSVAQFGTTSRIGELANKTPHIEMNNRFMEINNNEKSYFGAGFVNQSASLIRIPYEAKYCEGTTTKTITTNCTISSINEIRGFTEFFKVIPLVPNLTYTFTPGTKTITLMNLDNYSIDTDFEFEIDYNTAQFSSLPGNYAPILNEYNSFFGNTYYPEHAIAGVISARVDGDETPQLTYILNQDGSITFDSTVGSNDSHYVYISYVTSDALFAITGEDQTGAVGVNSVSFGKSNTVSGGYSAAIGKGLTTVSNNQVAIGKYNRCQSDSLFMVGNGDEPYDIEICLYLTSASNHPKLLIDMSKVTDSIQGGGCYFTTSDQYKWFFTIPNWYDENEPIVDISSEPFRVDDISIDFITHAAVDSIEVVAITVSQHADQGEHNIYLNSDVNTVSATNTPTMIYATFAPVERNPFEVKTNGDTYVQGNLFAGGDEFNSPLNITEPEKITLTYRQCTTGSYTRCYRLGQIVIISFNINVTTSTTNYDYITGLPPALEDGWAGSSGLPSAGMLRWWVTTDGTLRSDGAPTTGWHNGNIVYLCDKYSL